MSNRVNKKSNFTSLFGRFFSFYLIVVEKIVIKQKYVILNRFWH